MHPRDDGPKPRAASTSLTRGGIDLDRAARAGARAGRAASRERVPRGLHRRARARSAPQRSRRAARAPRASRSAGSAAREVGLRGARGAVFDPHAGQANGLGAVRGSGGPPASSAASRSTRTRPVGRVEEGATIRLETPRGAVRAPRASCSRRTPTRRPRLLPRRGSCPLHSHVLATEPLPASLERARTGAPPTASATISIGSPTAAGPATGRLVFGGGSNAAYAYRFGGSDVRATADDRRAFRGDAPDASCGYFPALAGSRSPHRWTRRARPDLRPRADDGRPGEPRNVFYALGYSGHGFVLGEPRRPGALRPLRRATTTAGASFPFYQRPPPRIPPEPLRWLGYQVYTRATGRSPRRR